MKLRFYGNALRLRLSRPEVDLLAQTGRVEDVVTFAPGRTFSYAIECGQVQLVDAHPAAPIHAVLRDHGIVIRVPVEAARLWIESGETGIENPKTTPKILIEKDFQCLHAASDDDGNSFPNPLALEK